MKIRFFFVNLCRQWDSNVAGWVNSNAGSNNVVVLVVSELFTKNYSLICFFK